MLKEHIEQILKNYKRVRNETFTEHPIATLLRTTFPEDLEKIIDEPNKYKITGSAGQGNWTYSPWVAIFDKRITKNAQSGFYPVYLFKEDMSGVYLSLNQGAADLKNKYGNKRANEILNKRSKEFREKLNGLIPVSDDLLESIDLKVENSPNAPFYETCNIYAKYYALEDLPSEEKLESDLKEILEIYDLLISEDFNPDHRGRAHIVRDICYLISKNEFPTEKPLYGLLGEKVVDEAYWKAYFQNCQKENCPKYNLDSARSLNLVQNDELKLTKLGEELITQIDPNELFTYNYSLGVKRFFYKIALEDDVVRRTMEILKEKRELRFFAPTCNRTNKVVWKYNKKTYKCEETKYPECSRCDRVLTGHIKETSLPFEAFRETGKRSGFVFWMCSRITPMHLTGHEPVYSGNYIYWDDKAEEELKMGLSDEKIKELLSWFVNSSETYKKWLPKRKTAEKINHEWIQPEIIEKMSYEDLKEHYLEYFNSGTGEKQNLIAIKRAQIIRNEKFRESLLYLLNEDVDIKTRIDELMDIKNEKHIDGMSRALLTAFLMDFKPDKYCLWNGKTESGFKALDWDKLYLKSTDSNGEAYIKVLGLLRRLRTLGSEFNLSFLDVDLFLHTISSEEEGKAILAKIKGEYKIRYFLEKLLKGYSSNRKNSLKTVETNFKSYLSELSTYHNVNPSFESELFNSDQPYFILYNQHDKEKYMDYPYFIAYFFKIRSKECYLTLNINRRYLRRILENEKKFPDSYYSEEFRRILSCNSSNLQNKFPETNKFHDSMDLYSNGDEKWFSLYRYGAVCAKKYDLNNLPPEEELESDLRNILELYTNFKPDYLSHDCDMSKNFFEYLSKKGYFFEQEIVENFLLSLKVKPFVILTGNSGTGKTKLAQLFGHYKNPKQSKDYDIIPVGANWTENRHIVGFYNVITEEYEKTPALDRIMNACNTKDPNFLILDEMNLSHVERYFSDFLSAMESGESIPLHQNTEIDFPMEIEKLPENLCIIGTVNVDETTYMFSPKVLDRANTIEFLTPSAMNYMNRRNISNNLNGNLKYLENPLSDLEIRNALILDLNKLLGDVQTPEGKFWDVVSTEIFQFQEILKKAGFDFGFRVINEIMRFMYVSWVYEGKPHEWKNWKRYFDAQIKQKMLPRIHGSQRTLEEVLNNLYDLCTEYPSSKIKLEEMKDVLYKQRYVSFTN